MKKTVDKIIKNKYIKEFNNDSPLIFKEALENINKLNEEGMIVNLYNENKDAQIIPQQNNFNAPKPVN